MKATLQSVFQQSVREQFSFLVDEFHFKGPFYHEYPYIGRTEIVFLASNVAVECVLDEKDDFVGCYVSKVIDGEIASPGLRDTNGMIVRKLLSTLAPAGVGSTTHPLFTRVTGLGLLERIPVKLSDEARVLKLYGKSVLTDSHGIF